jgi:hypothetical protein
MPELIPLSVLALDLPEPADGWTVELARRGVEVVPDSIGRPSISRDAARDLLTERREQEEAAAHRRMEIEERLVEKDRQFRAALPRGVPAGLVPEGLSAAELLMLSDPMRPPRRETMVEHALSNPGGALIYHPIRPEQADQ